MLNKGAAYQLCFSQPISRPERLIDYLKNRDVYEIIDCIINIAIVRIARHSGCLNGGYLRLYLNR